jgi:hypothetical protein
MDVRDVVEITALGAATFALAVCYNPEPPPFPIDIDNFVLSGTCVVTLGGGTLLGTVEGEYFEVIEPIVRRIFQHRLTITDGAGAFAGASGSIRLWAEVGTTEDITGTFEFSGTITVPG